VFKVVIWQPWPLPESGGYHFIPLTGSNTIGSDGIAAESKEAVGGFFIVNAATMDEAVSIARTCPAFNHGARLEVRQIASLDCD
jgi:hypothetical protein